LRIKVARIFNTYGPRIHPNDGRVVSNFIVQALLGQDITIYGDGSQTRSFCYVDDMNNGLVRLMATDDSVTDRLISAIRMNLQFLNSRP
jgi:UDP-glucuronate decarboxylase